MPISYNVIKRGEPGVKGGGNKKYYASAKTTGEIDIEQLTKRIEKISTVSGADIRAVLYGLVDVVPGELAEGNVVKIGDLGNFRVSISSEGYETAEEVNGSSIRKSRVIFTPGNKFKEMLNNLKFKKLSNGQ